MLPLTVKENILSDVVAAARELKNHVPADPVQMELWIRESNELLETMPEVLAEINERRYAAERNYSKVRNLKLVLHMNNGDSATMARAKAEVEALEALEQWHNTKAEYHYAEDTMKALQTKINSMLNINKGITTQYQAYRG